MEQKRIKVRLTENSPYSEYGYYEKGDIGYIDGYVNGCAVIILENGKFAKAELRWIEVVNAEDKNTNTEIVESEDEKIRKILINIVKGSCDKYGIKYQAKEIGEEKLLAWLEKQGEQKPADKVEPRFKIGDWVVYECGEETSTLQIARIVGKTYVFSDESTLNVVDEDSLRLWDITKDAKAGDVLYLQKDGKEHIIIYKGVIKERFRTFVSAYCAYNGIVDAFCFADVSRIVDIAYRGIMPATKEQRDLLFQKMKEAGYEWNAEKKELKNN